MVAMARIMMMKEYDIMYGNGDVITNHATWSVFISTLRSLRRRPRGGVAAAYTVVLLLLLLLLPCHDYDDGTTSWSIMLFT
jgi:hypothetical protein